jgi:hypothetical protein
MVSVLVSLFRGLSYATVILFLILLLDSLNRQIAEIAGISDAASIKWVWTTVLFGVWLGFSFFVGEPSDEPSEEEEKDGQG